MAGLLKRLGLKPAGGNYINMRRKLQRLKLNTDHWSGQSWNKNQQLKDWKDYTKISSIKPHLINLRSKSCEVCKLDQWLNKPISLEIHHKDGNRTNNDLTNLQLLCPNCHSYTDYYRNRKLSTLTEM
jgi:5-methylcytosine-specific restriction endonuclease McrA